MKKIISSIFAISIFLVSCDTNLDINRDPDVLAEVPMSSQLPAGILGTIGAEGTYYALVGGFWSQYWTQSNAANQYKDIDGYLIGTGDLFQAWANMYDALADLRQVKRTALASENWNYYLISTVMEVQASQILTDFYGSVPYTEANNVSILEPKFNSGEEIYDLMINDLNNALSKNLSLSKGIVPGSDDLIFSGNMSKWTKFANTLKLKIYMRQTNSSRAAIATSGITGLITSGTQFLDVDAGMTQFIDAPNQSNPLYESDRRILNTATNLRASRTLASFFDTNLDPRKDKYYGAGISYIQGNYENNSIPANTISVVNLSPTTPAFLMTLEESLFLQAEAQARYGTALAAKNFYDQAVSKNFSRYSLSSVSFINPGSVYEYPVTSSFELQLKAIITQKWIAAFPGNGFEAFFDTNRTGYPKVSSVPQSAASYIPGELSYSIGGATAGLFPRRIVYPQEETNTNKNTPSTTTFKITTPVWWD